MSCAHGNMTEGGRRSNTTPVSETDAITPAPEPGSQPGSSHDHRSTSRRHDSGNTSPSVQPHRAQVPPPHAFRASLFAERDQLSWWFPRIKDDEKKSWRIWISRRSRALMLQISIVAVIFTANISLTAFTFSLYHSQNGVGLIYDQDCTVVKNLDQWIHLLINLLGTGMLSASNYCMQLQAAPTRQNINEVHRKGRWLDIGIPSLRNLAHIGHWRRISWFLLAFSSLPIHLIYNSAVFQSLASYNYTVAVVKNSFVNGSSWSLATAEGNRAGDFGWDDSRVNPMWDYQRIISEMQASVMNESYEHMNTTACFDLYNNYWTPQGNVVILIKNESIQTPADDSLLMYVGIVPRWDDWGKNMWALNNSTGKFVYALSDSDRGITPWFLGPPRYEVSSCIVQPESSSSTKCRFEYSPPIMFTVCTLNLVKFVVMITIWITRRRQREYNDALLPPTDDQQHPEEEITQQVAEANKAPPEEVIYTLGDAIASFMREPDSTTQHMCLAPSDDFMRRRTWRRGWKSILRSENPEPLTEPREWKADAKRWMAAASVERWLSLMFVCFLVIAIAGILLGLSFTSLRHRKVATTLSGLWSLGFGALTPVTYLVERLPREDPAGLISNVLVANSPQLLLSILYLFCNAMLSTLLVQREFSRLHREEGRKTLRVSEPIGIQRSSYFISLPLRFGIPLYVTSGVMHWLVSQSLFLARVTAINTNGSQDFDNSFSTCGYSPAAIIVTMIVGFVLVVVVFLLGFFRRYDGTMRMVSTNSRAISAACTVLWEDRRYGYLLPVRWGVVEVDEQGVGHCSFTTAPAREIRQPQDPEMKDMRYW